MFCKAADNELQRKAGDLASSLAKATIEHGDVAAANLLLSLAETASYNENASGFERVMTLAEKWAREPQVVDLDTMPRLEEPVPRLALTDGKACAMEGSEEEEEPEDSGIIDADFEMVPRSPGD